MSTHCNKYPSCGCSSEIGTQCHLETKQRLEIGLSPQVKPYYIKKCKIFKGKIAPTGTQFVVLNLKKNGKNYFSSLWVSGTITDDRFKVLETKLLNDLKQKFNIQ